MIIQLEDAPGGAELISSLITAASDMALAFAGEPDDKVRAHLDRSCVRMERRLAARIGPTAAAQIVAALKLEALAQKAELELRPWGRA
jgi:hypothetical protein